jgi:hypothetical protein
LTNKDIAAVRHACVPVCCGSSDTETCCRPMTRDAQVGARRKGIRSTPRSASRRAAVRDSSACSGICAHPILCQQARARKWRCWARRGCNVCPECRKASGWSTHSPNQGPSAKAPSRSGPLESLERGDANPPPRRHRHRYHGVLAPTVRRNRESDLSLYARLAIDIYSRRHAPVGSGVIVRIDVGKDTPALAGRRPARPARRAKVPCRRIQSRTRS